MKSIELFRALGIRYETQGHKHCRPGWINMTCPYCVGNPGLHLGFNLDNEYFRCWRCGFHPLIDTLHRLTGLSIAELKQLTEDFGGRSRIKILELPRVSTKAFKHPTNTGPLLPQHCQYLESRAFDVVLLQKHWDLLGTGPIATLDHIDYKNRVLAPIYWEGREVSFQCRSIGTAEPKYRACPQIRERIEHQTILYGNQRHWTDTGFVVEGITDVWRLGVMSCATFGIEYTKKQVQQLLKHFKRIFVIFDDDPQAIQQAKKLVAELKFHGKDAHQITIHGDPGAMSQNDAEYLIKQLKGTRH